MRCSMQEIFREHFPAYAQGHRLHAREQRAGHCISNCYTAAMGAHVLACPEGHYERVQYHACGHRSCPRCAEESRQRWAQAQLAQLLPCPHVHVIFTLPHEFIALWAFNRARINQLLFDCTRSSLLELLAEPRHLGAMPGLLMALHSWGRTLSHHPHVHCLVSAGGLDPQHQWRSCRKPSFFLPIKPLQHLFRGMFLAQLKQLLNEQRLSMPPAQDQQYWRSVIQSQYRAHWNVQICTPYEHGRGVALYLARYVRGGPLPADRALDLSHAPNGSTVSFGYIDHLDGRAKTLRLSASEFIARILWHAPPQGQHTVRRAGLYASALRGQHRLSRKLLQPAQPPQPMQALACHDLPIAPEPDRPSCPLCRSPLLRIARPSSPHHLGEICIPSGHASLPLGPTLRSSGQSIGLADRPPLT
jgi:hypothetical protein